MIHDHGTPDRADVCDCWRCVNLRPWPASARRFEPKWDIGPLLLAPSVTLVAIKAEFGFERLISWRNHGLPDHEADRAALLIANQHPEAIWRGWHEACRDYYPETEPETEGVPTP